MLFSGALLKSDAKKSTTKREKKMLKKFITWLVLWEVSFLISKVTMSEQGQVFIYLYALLDVYYAWTFGESVMRIKTEEAAEVATIRSINWVVSASLIVTALIKAGLTWGISTIFQIDFYTTFQVLTLGACICSKTEAQSIE